MSAVLLMAPQGLGTMLSMPLGSSGRPHRDRRFVPIGLALVTSTVVPLTLATIVSVVLLARGEPASRSGGDRSDPMPPSLA